LVVQQKKNIVVVVVVAVPAVLVDRLHATHPVRV
jgi:hypothetical protein